MPLTLSCPQCGKSLNAPDALEGGLGCCPSCNHVFVLAADTAHVTPVTAVAPTAVTSAPPSADSVRPGKTFNDVSPNEFADYVSRGRPVYTPPRTFHRLFTWLLVLTALQFFVVAAFLALDLVVQQRTPPAKGPGRVVPGAYAELGGRTIYWRTLSTEEQAALVSAVASFLFATIAEVVVFFVLLYKCWALIQDGYPQTTPGKAVGFWFIPIYNLYWVFVAIRGLAEDLNRYASRRKIRAREVSVALATTYAVIKMIQLIPCRFGETNSPLSYLALVSMVFELVVMYQIKNAAADIAAARTG